MSFAGFIQECIKNENTNITHALYISENSVMGEYVRYPYKMDSLKLFFSMTKTFSGLATGIAWDLGLLHMDDPIIESVGPVSGTFPEPVFILSHGDL